MSARPHSRINSQASGKKRLANLVHEVHDAAARAARAARAAGEACGEDERARGWPCSALAPERCRTELERNHWVDGYTVGYQRAPRSVLPLRV